MRTTAQHRDTRFEIVTIQQGPNGYGLVCADRTTPRANVPQIEIRDEDLTEEEHAAALLLFTALERAFERKFLGWAEAPARVTEAVKAAVDAEKAAAVAEQRRAEAEAETVRLEQLVAKQTEALATLAAERAVIEEAKPEP